MENHKTEIRETVLKELSDEFLGSHDRQALARSIYVHFALESGARLAELASSLRLSQALVMNDNMHLKALLENGDDAAKAAVAKVRAALLRHKGEKGEVSASCEVHEGRTFSTIDLMACHSDAQRLIAVLSAWHLHGGIALGGGEAFACFPMPPDDSAVQALVAMLNDIAIGKSGRLTAHNAFRSLYPDVYRVG